MIFDNRPAGLGAITPTGYGPAIDPYTGAEQRFADGGGVQGLATLPYDEPRLADSYMPTNQIDTSSPESLAYISAHPELFNQKSDPLTYGSGFIALPYAYDPSTDPYLNGTTVGPSPGYTTNNPKIYNVNGSNPGAYEATPTEIGPYVDYLNRKFQQVNSYGRPSFSWTGVNQGINSGIVGTVSDYIGAGTSGSGGTSGSIPTNTSVPNTTGPVIPVNNPETNPDISPDQALWLSLNTNYYNPTNDYPQRSGSTESFDWGNDGTYTSSGLGGLDTLTEGNISLNDYANSLLSSGPTGSTEGFDFENTGTYVDPNAGISSDQALQYSLGQPSDYSGTDTSYPFDYNVGVGTDIMGYKFNPIDGIDMSTTLQDYGIPTEEASGLAGMFASKIEDLKSKFEPTYLREKLSDPANWAELGLNAIAPGSGSAAKWLYDKILPVIAPEYYSNQVQTRINDTLSVDAEKQAAADAAAADQQAKDLASAWSTEAGNTAYMNDLLNNLSNNGGSTDAEINSALTNAGFGSTWGDGSDSAYSINGDTTVNNTDFSQGFDWSNTGDYSGIGDYSDLLSGIYDFNSGYADLLGDSYWDPQYNNELNFFPTGDWYGSGYDETAYGAAGGRVTKLAAGGGIGTLPVSQYKAGGKFLRGGGDGMSDSIPAVIQGETPQQAALADGEFVIPADVVSHLGNGSSEAGSRRLYEMMDKIRTARTGTKQQGKQINPNKFLPG